MSLFDLQDVCIVIGSLATLGLPMVVDLIGIYVLKGPYCMLTMTDWFLQALSVIPRGVGIRIAPPGEAAEEQKIQVPGDDQYHEQFISMTFIGCFNEYLAGTCAWLQPELQERRLFTAEGFYRRRILLEKLAGTSPASGGGGGGGVRLNDDLDRPNGPGPTGEHSVQPHHRDFIVTPIADQIGPIDSVSKTGCYDLKNHFSEPQCKMTVLPLNSGKPRTCVTLNGSGIQLAMGPQPLRLRNHNSGLAHRIMVKRLATSPHDTIGITDSACKNQLVVVSLQYGPFNPYIPIRSTTIGKSRVAIDTIAMHTSWRSNSDITSATR
ncbi:hypothetical protein F511_07471 [Dorcoceras hygrometricum]|uniref:Uncharacterized protein n=1 Tax=Dorcoceras hygrometricum TaxID=472368 RepID=A0A2Z7AMA2_9LAMI|nr:hypothetical protein F511_07471 [Dorcoceras hygrometricum]